MFCRSNTYCEYKLKCKSNIRSTNLNVGQILQVQTDIEVTYSEYKLVCRSNIQRTNLNVGQIL